jgi:hypothetical protein
VDNPSVKTVGEAEFKHTQDPIEYHVRTSMERSKEPRQNFSSRHLTQSYSSGRVEALQASKEALLVTKTAHGSARVKKEVRMRNEIRTRL